MNARREFFEEFGPYAFGHKLSSYSYDGKVRYAPQLHVRANHMPRGKKPHHGFTRSERIVMDIPKAWTFADTKKYIVENETELYTTLQKMLDNEYDVMPEPITYGGVFPYLGKDLTIRIVEENGSPRIEGDAIYIPAGLEDKELRAAALDLLIDKAYPLLLPKIQHYSKIMSLSFSSVEIDDSRRTFGWFNDVTKEIVFSRRLLMLSEPIIDFLIVHELAHNGCVSHNKRHDAVIASILPNLEELDKAFNEGGGRLFKLGWI